MREIDIRELKRVAQGRIVPPARARPSQAPKLATARRSASGLVLSDRNAER